MLRRLLIAASLALLSVSPLAAKDRTETVREDKKNLLDDSYWIYNDLSRGITTAKRSGKPLLVVFR